MARTTIDIDAALVTDVMRRFRLTTKREAVDYFALRRAAGSTATTDGLLA